MLVGWSGDETKGPGAVARAALCSPPGKAETNETADADAGGTLLSRCCVTYPFVWATAAGMSAWLAWGGRFGSSRPSSAHAGDGEGEHGIFRILAIISRAPEWR